MGFFFNPLLDTHNSIIVICSQAQGCSFYTGLSDNVMTGAALPPLHRLRNPCSVFRVVSATRCTHHSKASRTRSVVLNNPPLKQKYLNLKSLCVLHQVGGVPGWQALLSAVGFRLDFSGSSSGLPAAVFFPTSDPGDRLQQCSTTLQSLLGTPLTLSRS